MATSEYLSMLTGTLSAANNEMLDAVLNLCRSCVSRRLLHPGPVTVRWGSPHRRVGP